MSSHLHLVFRSIDGQKPELLIGDLKRFTSKTIVKAIKENPKESRKEFLLNFFLQAGSKTSNVRQYQFWRHDNKPIELWSNHVINPPAAARLHRIAFSFKTSFSQIVLFFIFIKT